MCHAGTIRALPRLRDQKQDNPHAHNHVRGVQSRHAEVQSEKQRRVRGIGAAFAIEIVSRNLVMHPLVVILVRLHAQERAAQQQRQNQKQNDQILLPERGECTASAIVKLLQISTVVLAAPIRRLVLLLAEANAAG